MYFYGLKSPLRGLVVGALHCGVLLQMWNIHSSYSFFGGGNLATALLTPSGS